MTDLSVNPQIMRRLAFIKHLFETATSQSKRSDQTSAVSILLFHDAVESLAHLVAEQRDVRTSGKFLDYWDRLEALPYKNQMEKLNRLRVNLKHHGIHPSKQALEETRVHVRDFLVDATRNFFGIGFGEISLVDLVEPETAKQELRSALEFLERHDPKKAIERTCVGLMEILSLSTMEVARTGWLPPVRDKEGQGMLGWALGRFHNVEEQLFFLQHDLDLRDFQLLWQLGPNISRAHSGQLQIRDRLARIPTKEEAQRCIDFVTQAALRLAEYRSGYPPPF